MDGPGTVLVVHRRPGELAPREHGELLGALAAVADEFVPSLARRTSTTQTTLDGSQAPVGSVDAYFAEMVAQHTLLARAATGRLLGFASFRTGHRHPAVPGTSTYLSTIAVLPDARRGGVARRLYEALLALDEGAAAPVLLRTWSTNESHLHLLASLGFRLVLRLVDDRGPGVDTLYLRHVADGGTTA